LKDKSNRFKERYTLLLNMTQENTEFQDKVRDTLIKYSNMDMTDKASYHALEYFYPKFLQYLLSKKEEDLHILEVGVYKGGSMKCWMEIFPKAHFYGIDWNVAIIDPVVINDHRMKVEQLSQSDPRVQGLFPGVEFDLIIDDASHGATDQINTFKMLKYRLSAIGRYVIEDVYPENTYPYEFENQFGFVDITHIKNRGDDRLFVYPPYQFM